MEQLWGAIGAVFGSWMAEKAVTYRRVEKITGLLGTAVNVVQMVFGNTGENSGTGVCFTRDPTTGEKVFYGDFLINAQGEDVVAGIRTPTARCAKWPRTMPKVYKQLEKVRKQLEKHYQRHAGHGIHRRRRHPIHVADAHRQAHAGCGVPHRRGHGQRKADQQGRGVERIKSEDIERLFYPVIDPKVDKKSLQSRILGTGIDAVPGAAVGKVVFSAQEAEEWAEKGEKVILVRRETSPEDVGGMAVAQGILTATGGKTSHAAVVARGWGKCCIVGAEKFNIDYKTKTMQVGRSRQ